MAATVLLANLPNLLIALNGALGLSTQIAAMIREHPAAGEDLRTSLDALMPSLQSVVDQVAAYRPIPAETAAPPPLGAAATATDPTPAAEPSSAPAAAAPTSTVPDPAAPHVFASTAGSGDCTVCGEGANHAGHVSG